MIGRITEVVTAISWGSYYFEDLALIRRDQLPVAERYHTPTEQAAYPFVRTPAPAVSIGFELDSGYVVWGDCVPVSFSGKSGRALPKDPVQLAEWIETTLGPWFQDRTVVPWLPLEKDFLREFGDIPAFVRYGVSQAMVAGAAITSRKPFWQIFAEDLGYQDPDAKIPLHGSCGGDWHDTVDRMLVRRLKFLPQGQFEFLEKQIGTDGKALFAWIEAFKERATRCGYLPTLTLDFHGALDELCKGNLDDVAALIARLAEVAAPHPCHIESPLMAGDFAAFKQRITALRQKLSAKGLHSPTLRLVADEWANSLDDIRQLIATDAVDGVHIKMPDTGALSECAAAVDLLRVAGKFVLLGGSCTETILGAKVSANLGLVTRPDAVLVKPGMGFDESFAYLDGEMARALAEVSCHRSPHLNQLRSDTNSDLMGVIGANW